MSFLFARISPKYLERVLYTHAREIVWVYGKPPERIFIYNLYCNCQILRFDLRLSSTTLLAIVLPELILEKHL